MLRRVLVLLLMCPVIAMAEEQFLGDDQCVGCHSDATDVYKASQHGRVFLYGDATRLQHQGCESCHGAGGAHVEAVGSGSKDLKIATFSDERPDDSQACGDCHQTDQGMHWAGSSHEMSGVGCASCHTVHTEKPMTGEEQCASCHARQRTQIMRSSHHPNREGQMACSNCHDPHGGIGPADLKEATVNDNCYGCHQGLRGPFIWEHAPVREDCASCHDAHGSIHPAMLKTRDPFLCQQCHANAYHPSTLYDDDERAAVDYHLVGKACLNCHVQVHGSNHPSGVMLVR